MAFLGKDLAPSGGGRVLWHSYSHHNFLPWLRDLRNLPQPVGSGAHWNPWGLPPRQIVMAKAEIPMFCNEVVLNEGQFSLQGPLGNI